MNQVARCDWLPERARWSHLARSGLPAVFRRQNFTKSHIIIPLMTKFVRPRWLNIGLVLFLRVYGPTQKENLANIQPSWLHTWLITHTYKAMHGVLNVQPSNLLGYFFCFCVLSFRYLPKRVRPRFSSFLKRASKELRSTSSKRKTGNWPQKSCTSCLSRVLSTSSETTQYFRTMTVRCEGAADC